ncbi:MAG: CHASE2 domain-containing protein [Planctomycetes bacterium]|nr:CHASE2 domain-containing protein [Planctomycetota bacterium]
MKKFLKSAVFVSLLIGGASACLFSWLYYSRVDFLERIELAVKDYRFKARSFLHGAIPTDESIVYCNIDDESLKAIGQWPIPREYYTNVIRNLSQVGAGVIGFDVLFFENGVIHDARVQEAMQKAQSLPKVLEEGVAAEPTMDPAQVEKLKVLCVEIAAELESSSNGRKSQKVLEQVRQISAALEAGLAEKAVLQDSTIGNLQQLIGEMEATLKSPDEDLAAAATAQGQVLFPMVFLEHYSNQDAMEEANRELQWIANEIDSLFRRQKTDELYNLFDSSPFRAMARIRQDLAGDGNGSSWTKARLAMLQEKELSIISRVKEVEREVVQTALENANMIVSRRDLREADLQYWHIFNRGTMKARNLPVDPPLEPVEVATYEFLGSPARLYKENRERLQKQEIRETPFDKTHEAIFAEAVGGFIYNKGRNVLQQALDQWKSNVEDEKFKSLDYYVRHSIAEEKSVDLRAILVDPDGQPPRDEEHAQRLMRTLRVARDRPSDPTKPIVRLGLATAEPVYITVEKDVDGSLRNYALLIRSDSSEGEPRAFFAMGFGMACRHLGVALKDVRICPGHFIDLPGAKYPDGRVADIRIPIDEHGQMLINWAGTFEDTSLFKHFSFAEIVNPEGAKKHLEELKGKLVLIGLTGTGTHDIAPMPFSGNYPMVGAHANVINTILTRNFLKPDIRLSRALNVAIICFLAMFVAMAKAVLPRFWGTVGFAGMFALYAIGVQVAFVRWGLSLNVTYSFFAITVPFTGVLLYRYMTEERQKKLVRAMFSTMVSPEVLQYMQEHPDRFRLTGEKRMATMFFSDVAGFTTISEKLSAEGLAKVLNEYLTPMSDIILSYNGYIDKYEGDAIMADFGVPFDDPKEPNSHAWKACWSALDQQEKLQDIRRQIKEQYNVDIDVRMGINSGLVSAGNMGSQKKFQYTVMGDAVNQAARFEPANKPFGTHIMIGEPTYKLAQEKIEVRFLASMIVKGKTEPVKCYELLAKKGKLPEKKRWLVELFEEGWRLHAEKNFEAAIAKFDECLMVDPEDGPSKTYREISQEYLQKPPSGGWAGEWIQTSK